MLAFGSAVGNDIGNYLSALIGVYIVLILAYLVASMALAAGVRLPASRVVDAIMKFLRDVCEPYLRLFRKLIPSVGMIDLSPMVAIICLWILDWLIGSLFNG